MPVTYASYLKLDQLLDLQEPKSSPAEHDELLFIVIHQTYELWFKQLLHELDKVARDFAGNDLFGAIATFKRVRTIMKTLVGQLDILETMTPLSFASFRNRLDTASGFQSYQFREVEFFLGYKRPNVTAPIPDGEAGKARAIGRLGQPSLVDGFYRFLAHRGVVVPESLLAKPITEPTESSEALQEELLRIYRTSPELVILFELMLDFDEGMQEWRYRHVKLVERTIGAKQGTGGSAGVEFLKTSLFKPLFPDLWVVRHRM
ncbi:MAG: tryptophan 2,3-dioxygenase [Gemmatimonadetes bacterium]|nr:tryptophan 2,3-dioxygenase [Gemmatimonadota bacterium]